MKKSLFYLLLLFLYSVSFQGFAQDYGLQFKNSDFEAKWQEYSGGKKQKGLLGSETISGNEPYCWHSFMSAEGTKLVLANVSNQISNSSETRPGSKGSHSVRLNTTKTLSIIANGSLTNGRMNCGSISANDDDNHIYTDRNNGDFNMPFSGPIPDSLTVWVSFYTTSDSYEAAIHAAIHGDANFILYGNGKSPNASQQTADAECNYTRTTSNRGTLVWERKSIPFVAKGNCTEPKYILYTMSTNKTPAKGSEDDLVYVDDIVLIYNPTLSTGTLAQTEFEAEHNTEIPIEVPFTLTGSMSVSNLNVAPNQVIAQLSDANGSFENPTEIGRVQTNTSGVVSAAIPASVASGTYKVRVVSTNYPMTAAPSSSEITIQRYYTISFVDEDASIASLSGAGIYYENQTKTITVSAETLSNEYKFLYWYEDGTAVSLEQEYTFNAERSRQLQAVFKKQCIVEISASEGGEVSSNGGSYGESEGVTVTASALDGYKFTNWTINGQIVSTNPTYTFSVSEDCSLVANFDKYVSIVVTTNIEGAGAISGAGDIIYSGENANVTLVAIPSNNDTYQFVNWTENGTIVSESSVWTFETNENRTIIANFIARYTIEAIASEGGETSGSATYTSGESVQLVAFADEKYRFSGWFEADTLYSTNSTIQFTAETNRSFTANFIEQCQITVVTNIPNAAIVSGAGVFDKGATVSVSASANKGFVFEHWEIGDAIVSDEEIYEFIVNESITITAYCSKIPSFTINVVANPTSGGVISGSGTFYENEPVTLSATANTGFSFVGWQKDEVLISEEATLSFNATENVSLVALFNADFVGHAVSLSSNEGGSVFGAGLFAEGEEITITATANDKFAFVQWEQNGEVISTEPEYTFTITEDVEIQAVFTRTYESHTIAVSSADETQGTVSGTDLYQEESTVTVTATPNEGYRFLQWVENEVVVSTDAEYTFVCSENRNLTAEFIKTYIIAIADFEGATVKGLGTGVFDEGATVTLAVTPDESHRFVAWKENDTIVSTAVTLSFTATSDRIFSLSLQEKGEVYSISVSTGGTVAGLNNGKFESGETVTLIATPAEGYLFKGWVCNGEIIGTETMLTFEANANMQIYAEFVAKPKAVTVAVKCNDETFGSITGAGTYTEGDEVMLIAAPAPGYTFVMWTKDGKALSNLSTLYFTIVDNCTIEAEFKFIEKTDITDIAETKLSIFPNPATTFARIQSNSEIASVSIATLQGSIMAHESVGDTIVDLNLTNLTRGLYVVTIVLENGEIKREKLIINK